MQYYVRKLRTAACKARLIWVERKTPHQKVCLSGAGNGVGVGIKGSK